MSKHSHAKQERIVEAVRLGLEGMAAVEFIQKSGFSMTSAGIARHLKRMGGRGRILSLIESGKGNGDILEFVLPEENFEDIRLEPPNQQDLFGEPPEDHILPFDEGAAPLYDMTKLTIAIPSDLHEALRLAARAEGKTQNQLISEILISVLSRMPDDFRRNADE